MTLPAVQISGWVAMDNGTMLWKPEVTFVLLLLILPLMPDFGWGAPEQRLPSEIQHVQTALFDALDELRAELKTHRNSRR